MKDKTIDTEMNEAINFYAHLAVGEKVVINTDVGFLGTDGECVFEDFHLDAHKLQKEKEQADLVLRKNGLDPTEVMQFFEMVVITRMVLDDDYMPQHLVVNQPRNLHEEPEDQRTSRRSEHLFMLIKDCVQMCQPEILHISDDGNGFAIAAEDAHPLLKMYITSMQTRYAESASISQNTESMYSDDVKGFLNRKVAERDTKADDIDPDSDENDDDPFRGYA